MAGLPMSHRGEGSVYQDKPPPAKKVPGPPGSGPSKPSTEKVQVSQMSTSGTSSDLSAPGGDSVSDTPPPTSAAKALPDPATLTAEVPPPPPLPESGNIGGKGGTQSELAQRMADAKDTHTLAAHKIVGELRDHLNQIATLTEAARHDLTDTVGARTIIVHGPTGTGKSTVVPWEAMRWLEEYCASRRSKAGLVICSQQRPKVTISLAEEVRRMGHAVVGYHVSKDRNAPEATRLMYLTDRGVCADQ